MIIVTHIVTLLCILQSELFHLQSLEALDHSKVTYEAALPCSCPALVNDRVQLSIKGAVSRCFSAIFDIAGLKPWLSTIAHTRNAPRTSRERYQVNYWRKGELQFILGYFFKPKWQNLNNST